MKSSPYQIKKDPKAEEIFKYQQRKDTLISNIRNMIQVKINQNQGDKDKWNQKELEISSFINNDFEDFKVLREEIVRKQTIKHHRTIYNK